MTEHSREDLDGQGESDGSATTELGSTPLPPDTVGLLEGIATTRSIRRYKDDPVPPEVLRAILFAATRAPSGHNRQPFRFMVLTDGPKSMAAKRLIGESARRMWSIIISNEGYKGGSGVNETSRKARMYRTMQNYVDEFERIPVLILCCVLRQVDPVPGDRGRDSLSTLNIAPAIQNILLAARALGYGGVYTGWNVAVDRQLRDLLDVPDTTIIHSTVTLGKPAGRQGPVRRRPLPELVFGETWGEAPDWAVDPPWDQLRVRTLAYASAVTR